jgi:hypothetical protein
VRLPEQASAVVTMFSISELACASISGRVLTSTAWFGSWLPAAFEAARAARASMHALRMVRHSIAATGGSAGSVL